MWGISNGVGLIGLCLNIFTAGTWMIAGQLRLSEQPFQLKVCIFAGLAYGMVETLPSLAMKHDLACECATEEWYGQKKGACQFTVSICVHFHSPLFLAFPRLWLRFFFLPSAPEYRRCAPSTVSAFIFCSQS
jgi:hypothetical protein